MTGYGSDQIVSARLISAEGALVEASESVNPDLLYCLRGAGQFFGLVTELTIRTYPLSVLGNPEGVVWSGSFTFPLDRVKEVTAVMPSIMNDTTYATRGLLMITSSPPPDLKPVIWIVGNFLGNPDEASKAYKPLFDLKPMKFEGGPVPIQNLSDALQPVCEKGGFKRFNMVGMTGYVLSRSSLQIFLTPIRQLPRRQVSTDSRGVERPARQMPRRNHYKLQF